MPPDRYRRNTPFLLALLVPAALYLIWEQFARLSTFSTFDGSAGWLLGLAPCSRPAANGMDLIFFERGGLKLALSGWSGLGWLALNALVMFVGWATIVVGAARFTTPNG